ncbi:MAG: hypothetical protein KAG66_15335 [Methylococcales bacterium]|nr:hypothetical protein [Methylococcales bacterium]
MASAADVLRSEARQNPPVVPAAAVDPPADWHFVPVEAPERLGSNLTCINCKPTTGKALATEKRAKSSTDLLRSATRQNPSVFVVNGVDPPDDTHSEVIGAFALCGLPSLNVACKNCMPATGKPLSTEKFAASACVVLRSKAKQKPLAALVIAVEPPADIHSAPVVPLALSLSCDTEAPERLAFEVLMSDAKQISPVFQAFVVELPVIGLHSIRPFAVPNVVSTDGANWPAAVAITEDSTTAKVNALNKVFFIIIVFFLIVSAHQNMMSHIYSPYFKGLLIYRTFVLELTQIPIYI